MCVGCVQTDFLPQFVFYNVNNYTVISFAGIYSRVRLQKKWVLKLLRAKKSVKAIIKYATLTFFKWISELVNLFCYGTNK